MRYVNLTLALLTLALPLAGCDDTDEAVATIELRDACDAATFNAALGPGTCQSGTRAGGPVTLPAFTAELTANRSVATWNITPATLEVKEGTTVPVMNTGGETHTYTEVEEFGGGVVPMLNQLSGNTTVAPECADAAVFASSTVAAGATVQHTFDEAGTEKYQCCIHPWMRQTAHVQ